MLPPGVLKWPEINGTSVDHGTSMRETKEQSQIETEMAMQVEEQQTNVAQDISLISKGDAK